MLVSGSYSARGFLINEPSGVAGGQVKTIGTTARPGPRARTHTDCDYILMAFTVNSLATQRTRGCLTACGRIGMSKVSVDRLRYSRPYFSNRSTPTWTTALDEYAVETRKGFHPVDCGLRSAILRSISITGFPSMSS
jgi:hypothetical protein